jgi:hypothetical protein
MRRSPLLFALLALALLFSACGKPKQPKADELREKISVELRQATSSLTKKQADCYADLLVDELGAKVINDIDITDKEPEPAVAKGIATAATKAGARCGIGGTATTAPVDGTSTTVAADPTTTTSG